MHKEECEKPQIQIEVENGKKSFYTDGYLMSIGEIINMYKEKELILNPDYQRLFRWSIRQQSRFIESILLGIPLPTIFVFQNEKGVWEIVDGVQRISTILKFIGELRKINSEVKEDPSILESTKILPSMKGLSWADLPKEPLQLEFKRTKIEIKIIKNLSDANAKFEVFQRLNRGGTDLSDQELRNCSLIMTNKSFDEWLEKLKNDTFFLSCLSLSDKLIKEDYHKELLLRLFVFPRFSFTQTRIDEYLDDSIFYDDKSLLKQVGDKIFDLTNEEIKFRNTFKMLFACAGENVFKKKYKGQFLESYFEIFAIGLYSNIDSYKNNEESIEYIKQKIESIENDKKFIKLKKLNVNTKARVPNMVSFGLKYFKNEQKES